MFRLITAGALALVSACAAPMQAQEYGGAAPEAPALVPLDVAPGRSAIACDIRAARTAKGLRLEAVAEAGRSVHGTYDFVITAKAPGGSSAITQGGEVRLVPGQGATLGSAEIPRGGYRAVLTLSDAGGELCHLDRRS